MVGTYLFTSIGFPVYLHYCGGELETVSMVIKDNTCCGEEEEEMPDNGCCKDEGLVLQSALDFTLEQISVFHPLKTELTLFYSSFPDNTIYSSHKEGSVIANDPSPPPEIQANIISTSVLRI